jgi:hypothetical protein
MMNSKSFLPKSVVLLVLTLTGFISNAQTITTNQNANNVQLNTITTAVPFLMISGNAYEMGSANVGVVANNQYHETAFTANPALLANGHKYLSTRVGFTPWLRALVPDINLITHSVSGTINKRNALGVYIKYFDLGDITFTDNTGQTIGSFNPNEFVVQLNYAHWFPMGLSIGVAGKYIYSNLTGGLNVGGADTRPGMAGAVDLGLSYRKYHHVSDGFGIGGNFGIALNNIGNKMSYTNTAEKDFLPMNMMLGAQLNIGMEFGIVRFEHDLGYQVTKLLVPTPPIVDNSPYLNNNLPPGDTLGAIGHPNNANPTLGSAVIGKDPNVGVFQGMIQSFNDAPGGTQEEWREVIHQVSHEFRFILNDVFMLGFREGFFYEHATKGNRQFVSLGGSIGGAGFRLDVGGWIPVQERSPLDNTFFATLSYRMIIGRPKKRMRYPKWNSEKEFAQSMELKLDEE